MAAAMSTLEICVLQTQQTSSTAVNVGNLFSASNPSNTLNITTNIIPVLGDDQDVAQFEAVKLSITQYLTADYLIYILDTSISSTSPSTINQMLNQIITLNNKLNNKLNNNPTTNGNAFDLCYLCKWMDDFSKHRIILPSLADTTSRLVETISPFGFQAIMFSNRGLNKFSALLNSLESYTKPLGLILNDQISKPQDETNYVAYAVVPNLINFDAIYSNPNGYDYVKLSEAKEPLPLKLPIRDANLSFFWFLVTVIVVILIGYFLIKIGPYLDGTCKTTFPMIT